MTNNYNYLLTRLSGLNPDIRAADADRERTAERLRKAHAEGRLDMDEFQKRLEHCYEAKTYGELSQLVTDLPRQDEPDRRRPVVRLGLWRVALVPILPILLVLFLISAVVGHHVFWLWIPFAFLVWRMSWWGRRRRWAGARRGPGDWF